MSDLATLHDRLSRLLAAPSVASGTLRHLSFESGQARAAIRGEIDETQLARRLVFRNDRDEEIALDVVSGRVLRSAKSQASCATEQNESRPAKAPHDQPDVSGLRREIKQFAENAVSLTVEVFILKRTSMVLDMGVPADALFCQSASLSENPVVQQLRTFVVSAGDSMLYVFASDEDRLIFEQGDVKTYGELEHKIAPLLRAGAFLPETSTFAECIVFAGSVSDRKGILCARSGHLFVGVIFERHKTDAVLQHWSATFPAA